MERLRGREERGFEFGDYLGGWGLIDGEGLVEKRGWVGVLTGQLIAGFGVLGGLECVGFVEFVCLFCLLHWHGWAAHLELAFAFVWEVDI